MAASAFTSDDIIVLGECRRCLFPKKLQSLEKNLDKECLIVKNFYLTGTLDVVNQLTNQYAKVFNLMLYKQNAIYKIKDETGNGLSADDIARFFFVNCGNTLPVNIITNNKILSSILKFIFSNHLLVSHFPLRDAACVKNTKNKPKVIIWNLFYAKKNSEELLNLDDIIQFIKNYPKKYKFTIEAGRKHVYLRDFYQREKNLTPQEEKHPASWLRETWGGEDCNEQKPPSYSVPLYLNDTLDNVEDSLSYLKSERFTKLYNL